MISNEFYDNLQKARNAIYHMSSLQSQFYEQNDLLEKERIKYDHEKKCPLGSVSWIFISLTSLFGSLPLSINLLSLFRAGTSTGNIFLCVLLAAGILFAMLYGFIKIVKLIIFRVRSQTVYKQRGDQLVISTNSTNQTIVDFYNTGFRPALLIPPNYRYPLAVDYIIECLVNSRAENIKEAINLYEQQVHYWKIENYFQQLQIMQRQQYMAIQSAERAARRAASAAAVSAINSFRR